MPQLVQDLVRHKVKLLLELLRCELRVVHSGGRPRAVYLLFLQLHQVFLLLLLLVLPYLGVLVEHLVASGHVREVGLRLVLLHVSLGHVSGVGCLLHDSLHLFLDFFLVQLVESLVNWLLQVVSAVVGVSLDRLVAVESSSHFILSDFFLHFDHACRLLVHLRLKLQLLFLYMHVNFISFLNFFLFLFLKLGLIFEKLIKVTLLLLTIGLWLESAFLHLSLLLHFS